MSSPNFTIVLSKRVLAAGLLGGAFATVAYLRHPHLCLERQTGRYVARVRKCYADGLFSPPKCVDVKDAEYFTGTVCVDCGQVKRADREQPIDRDKHEYEDRVNEHMIWMTKKQAEKLWLYGKLNFFF